MKRGRLRWKRERGGAWLSDWHILWDGVTVFATVIAGNVGWSRAEDKYGPWMNTWADGKTFTTIEEAKADAMRTIKEMLAARAAKEGRHGLDG